LKSPEAGETIPSNPIQEEIEEANISYKEHTLKKAWNRALRRKRGQY